MNLIFKKSYILIFLLITLIIISGCKSKKTKEEYEIPSVSISILSDFPLTIGDHIDIVISAYHDNKDRVIFPTKEDSFSPFIIKAYKINKKRVTKANYKTNIVYTITIFQTGEFNLNPVQVQIGNKAFNTEPLNISILSVLPKNVKNPALKDIIPPRSPKTKPVTIVIILFVIMTVIIIFFITKRFLQKRKTLIKEPKTEEFEIDPYEYSIDELSKLKTVDIKNKSDVKVIYSKISFILRFFIGKIEKIKALEMTTLELAVYIKTTDLKFILYPGLINILKRADMVKFAREKVKVTRINSDIEESINIIESLHNHDKERFELEYEPTNHKEVLNPDGV